MPLLSRLDLAALPLVAVTLLVSAAGGFLAHLVGLPAGWLVGGALGVTVAAMAGVPVQMPPWLRDITFLLIGMSMGASVAPNSLQLIASWPISLLALAIELALIIALTGWMLTRWFKLDPGTAYLSSFPGHLSFIMAITATGVGDARQITIIQVVRIFMLTICVPVGTMFFPVGHPTVAPAGDVLDLQTLVLLALGCAAMGWVFLRIKVPAGFVLGAMFAATVAKLAGWYDGALPEPLVIVSFVFTGALIGSRFAGVSRAEFMVAAKGGLIATAMTISIVTVIAYGVSLLVDMPFGQIWIGLSPGALEGMGALGIALGYDTAFIAAHHVIRLLMLSFVIPTVLVVIRRLELRRAAAAIAGKKELEEPKP